MKTIIAALTLLALSSQGNANDAVKQGIITVLQCIQNITDAGPGKPLVSGDALVVATRACHNESNRLVAAMDAAGFTHQDKVAVVDDMVKMMFDAWAVE